MLSFSHAQSHRSSMFCDTPLVRYWNICNITWLCDGRMQCYISSLLGSDPWWWLAYRCCSHPWSDMQAGYLLPSHEHNSRGNMHAMLASSYCSRERAILLDNGLITHNPVGGLGGNTKKTHPVILWLSLCFCQFQYQNSTYCPMLFRGNST